MIKTKKDFEGKYIKLPKNISKKKLNRIKKKFNRLGFEKIYNYNYQNMGYTPYVYIFNFKKEYGSSCYDNELGAWSWLQRGFQEISIKEFLEEETSLGKYLKENKKEIISEGYNCIPSKYLVFYGTDLKEIKEDVERSIQDFSYGKPKKFKDGFEAVHWCIKNPFKEVSISHFAGDFIIRYSDIIQNLQWKDNRKCSSCNNKDFSWHYLNNYTRDILKYWKDIVEYRECILGIKEKKRYLRVHIGFDWGNSEFKPITTIVLDDNDIKK